MRPMLPLLVALALVAIACSDGSPKTESTTAGRESVQTTNEANGDEAMVFELSVDTITVAYSEQSATPNLYDRADGSFDEAVGAAITWVPFGSGAEMSVAMEAGDVDISYGQDLTSFATTVNNDEDIRLVGIAAAHAPADSCVAQGVFGVTLENAADVLDGATVMTPTGDITNLKMVSTMDVLGVDLDSLKILPTTSGSATAAAFEAGDIDIGCAVGDPLTEMLDFGGDLLMTGAEQATAGGSATYDSAAYDIAAYEIVSIPTSFGDRHPDAVVSFLAAIEQFNDAGAAFPSIEDQLSDSWMGGTVAADMAEQVQTFVDLGQIDATIGDFSASIDTSFLEDAADG